MSRNTDECGWHIVKLVVNEAQNRYGLILHGRFYWDNNEPKVSFLCEEIMYEFSQVIDGYFLDNESEVALFAEFGVYPSLKKLVRIRDGKNEQSNS